MCASHGPRTAAALPVVCLPGLTRTVRRLRSAGRCPGERSRDAAARDRLDYRGRGRSDYDPNPANYNLAVELADVLAVLTALDIARAVFVGTSRGGILIMLLAPPARRRSRAACSTTSVR